MFAKGMRHGHEQGEDHRFEDHARRGAGRGVRRPRAASVPDDARRPGVLYADYAKPEGFCDEAWKAVYQYVFALAHGGDGFAFYHDDWMREPGCAIVSCNDGLRPVIMKLEATDLPAELGYEPVR